MFHVSYFVSDRSDTDSGHAEQHAVPVWCQAHYQEGGPRQLNRDRLLLPLGPTHRLLHHRVSKLALVSLSLIPRRSSLMRQFTQWAYHIVRACM